MDLKQFLLMFVQSLNPRAYTQLLSRKKREVASFFITLLLYCVLLSGLTNIPNFVNFPKQVEGAVSKISTLNITGLDVEITEPVTLLETPKVVIDFSENNTLDKEFVLITKNEIFFKKFQPKLFNLFITEQKPVSELGDVLNTVRSIKGTYWIVLFILLPSLFFISYLLNFTKYSIIITLVFILSFIILKLTKKKLNFQHHLKAAFYSSTIMIFLDIVISPLFNLSVIPFLLYLGILTWVLINQKDK